MSAAGAPSPHGNAGTARHEDAPAQPFITVTLVHSPAPRTWEEQTLRLPAGATLADALSLSGWKERLRLVGHPELVLGVWGRQAPLDAVLHDGDRVEVVRPLRVDPKVARRERFRKQGTRAAGLFSRAPTPPAEPPPVQAPPRSPS